MAGKILRLFKKKGNNNKTKKRNCNCNRNRNRNSNGNSNSNSNNTKKKGTIRKVKLVKETVLNRLEEYKKKQTLIKVLDECFKHLNTHGIHMDGLFRVNGSEANVISLVNDFNNLDPDYEFGTFLNDSINVHDISSFFKKIITYNKLVNNEFRLVFSLMSDEFISIPIPPKKNNFSLLNNSDFRAKLKGIGFKDSNLEEANNTSSKRSSKNDYELYTNEFLGYIRDGINKMDTFKDSFYKLIKLLKKITTHSDITRMTPTNLASIFVPILFEIKEDLTYPERVGQLSKFVELLIINSDRILIEFLSVNRPN
jgi:hypothetical protein